MREEIQEISNQKLMDNKTKFHNKILKDKKLYMLKILQQNLSKNLTMTACMMTSVLGFQLLKSKIETQKITQVITKSIKTKETINKK